MLVQLLNQKAVIASLRSAILAGLTCTANAAKINEYHDDNLPTQKGLDFLARLTKAGHESVLEHIVLTFNVSKIRRGLLQELARHRHLSLSVESTRWALHKNLNSETVDVFPEDFGGHLDEWGPDVEAILQELHMSLQSLVWNLSMVSAVVPNDRLKDYIPESFTCNLVMTVNLRELRHIYKLRANPPAWQPFQDLCELILNTLPEAVRELVVL